MSEFTQIDVDIPIVVPPVAEKVYNKKWISHFRMNSPSPDKATVVAHLIPYNGESVLSEPVEQVVIDNVFEAMQDPNRTEEQQLVLVQAMELILRAVKSEWSLKNTPDTTLIESPSAIDDTTLIEQPSA